MKTRILVFLFAVSTFVSCRNVSQKDDVMPEELVPMYGGQSKTEARQNRKFSASMSKIGWRDYYSGNLDDAMRRFNQAWLFDRENADAFWGFGVIMGRRGKSGHPEGNFKESIGFLETASRLNPSNPKITVDLAYSHALLGSFYKDGGNPGANGEFEKSRALFQEAEKADPGYPLVYSNQSVLYFYMGEYPKAKEYMDKAEKMGFKPDPSYIRDLESALKSGD